MKMASLKQKWSDHAKGPALKEDDEYYPSLYLDEKLLDAMGVATERVGTELIMTAKVRVSNVSESKSGARSMGFEIVEAAMKSPDEDDDKAGKMFPNDRK